MGLEEVSININDHTLKLETGKLAKQADGSVPVQYGDNIEERSLEVFSKEKDALVHQLY